jgi:hypothetical protein
MRSESQIKHCLRECELNAETFHELDSTRYINTGWVEALKYVLKSEPTLEVTSDLQVKVK